MLILAGQLYEKNDEIESINTRKTLIENDINLYKQFHLCNEISLTGFFPHLDIVNEIISIDQLSGYIPCWELGEETFYAKITYTDSCHVSSDLNKCIEPVPNLVETKYIRNTLTDEDCETAEYTWISLTNQSQIQVSNGFNNKILKVSASAAASLKNISLSLEYLE